MTLNLQLPPQKSNLSPHITVIGVGGAGGNAVNNMIRANLQGANFVVANSDAQALEYALTEKRMQLGTHVTQGLGAGASPDVGRAAAEESIDEIENQLRGSNMVFITAGMGGGTGTGAAPVVARIAREMGVLTVGVVTKPFHFEGVHRMRLAEQGLEELQKYVDTLIVIPNQNLFRVANERTTFADAFAMADEVLHSGVRGITDLMTMPGLINLDFADIRAVMSEMGKAMMGTGEAEGDRRAIEAAEAAISNPLLDDVSMKGAKGVLINITGGPDLTLFEVDEAANRIREEVDPEANIIFGAIFNPELNGKMRVSVVATGVESEAAAMARQAAKANAGIAPKPQQMGMGGLGKAQRPLFSAPPAPKAEKPLFVPVNARDEQQPEAAQPAPDAEFSYNQSKAAQQPSFQPQQPTYAAPEAPSHPQPVFQQPQPQAHIAPSQAYAAPQDAPAGAFIPPRPMEASSRPQETAPLAFRKMPEPQQQAMMDDEDDGRPKSGFGSSLLQRVSRAFTIRVPDMEVENHQELPKPQMEANHGGAKSGDEQGAEEYLDIPAFLRRQG
ncbi:cell division protein FtsZ [bacterium]|nr:cell division protein FtsZ [bacterium]